MDIGISEREQLAVRFYMGDPAAVQSGICRGGGQAYNTINALLHPGSANEEDKIREGRQIVLEDANHLKEYLDIILNVYSAMCKYRDAHLNDTDRVSYRIDRKSSLDRFIADQGIIAGFFSTCRWGFLSQYAHKKAGIVLLQITRSPGVPYLDFSDMFGDLYAKPEEAEVLLPYGAVMSRISPVPLTEEEKQIYTDLHGEPPAGKWEILVEPGRYQAGSTESGMHCWEAAAPETLFWWVTAPEQVQNAIACLRRISEGGKLSEEMQVFYNAWKRKLQAYIMIRSDEIERRVSL